MGTEVAIYMAKATRENKATERQDCDRDMSLEPRRRDNRKMTERRNRGVT